MKQQTEADPARPPRGKGIRVLRIFGIVVASIITVAAVALGAFAYQNIHYDEKPLANTYRAGYQEKQVTLPDGTVLNYAEGPDRGPALLLLHGQLVEWEDYTKVLPGLAEHYHVYAVDVPGHGQSTHDASKYTGVAIGRDLVWFIENVIGEPCVVSGHSSGGILAAWVAANAPKDVLGVVLEDPPFFKVQPEEMQNTFAWRDNFAVVHGFRTQTAEADYVTYYVEHSYLVGLFGGLQPHLADSTEVSGSASGSTAETVVHPLQLAASDALFG